MQHYIHNCDCAILYRMQEQDPENFGGKSEFKSHILWENVSHIRTWWGKGLNAIIIGCVEKPLHSEWKLANAMVLNLAQLLHLSGLQQALARSLVSVSSALFLQRKGATRSV